MSSPCLFHIFSHFFLLGSRLQILPVFGTSVISRLHWRLTTFSIYIYFMSIPMYMNVIFCKCTFKINRRVVKYLDQVNYLSKMISKRIKTIIQIQLNNPQKTEENLKYSTSYREVFFLISIIYIYLFGMYTRIIKTPHYILRCDIYPCLYFHCICQVRGSFSIQDVVVIWTNQHFRLCLTKIWLSSPFSQIWSSWRKSQTMFYIKMKLGNAHAYALIVQLRVRTLRLRLRVPLWIPFTNS